MYNFYSLTIYLLHYYPRHVSSINMPILRRKNFIHTASGIFALCIRLPSTLVESGLQSALNQCTVYYVLCTMYYVLCTMMHGRRNIKVFWMFLHQHFVLIPCFSTLFICLAICNMQHFTILTILISSTRYI